jgi:hypothetical protein
MAVMCGFTGIYGDREKSSTYAWFAGNQLMQWLTSATGFFIAWAQWDTARFNRTGCTSVVNKGFTCLLCSANRLPNI